MKPVPPPPVAPRARLKTYSHLAAARRIPTEYDIATSRLLYHPERGFELPLPVAAHHETYQRDSPLQCDDWEAFADPRQTTYTRYTAIMSEREAFTSQLFERMEEGDYEERLSAEAVQLFAEEIAPLRYPLHGLQRVTAYVGQMAPAGRITIASALQAADETRRIERIAYRMGQLRQRRPGLGEESRARWQEHPAWQPLRRLVERLLIAWDWGEAFTALQLCIKPAFDHRVNVELAERARGLGDYLLSEVLGSFREDGAWHGEWSSALVEMAIRQRPGNEEVLRTWRDRWSDPAAQAVRALAPRDGERSEGLGR